MEAFGSGSQAPNKKVISEWLMERDWVVNKGFQATAPKNERRA